MERGERTAERGRTKFVQGGCKGKQWEKDLTRCGSKKRRRGMRDLPGEQYEMVPHIDLLLLCGRHVAE